MKKPQYLTKVSTGNNKYPARIVFQIPLELRPALEGMKFEVDYFHGEGILLRPLGLTANRPAVVPSWAKTHSSAGAREQDA